MTDVIDVPVAAETDAVEAKVGDETSKEEVKDLVPELYDQHGGDPRLLDISFCVLLSRVSSAFLTDSFETFTESIKSMLSEEIKLDPATLKQVVRIPKLEQDAPDQSNALRVLLCFTEKTHKHRMMGRKKDIEISGMKVESLDELPAELLEISDEDARAIADLEMADEVGEDEVAEEVDEDEHEEIGTECDEDATGQEESVEGVKKEEEDGQQKKETDEDKKADKPEPPKKKVYEDEDAKAPFEMNWEGAPEFQWRLCDGPRDEKKLVIENLLWSDLNNVFIYRTIQKATNCELNFPMRYANEGTKAAHGKMSLHFPGFVAIMDEALKHLIYFRSGDGRRIKVFLPQTAGSLKRKEDFEGKLGRLIKPTPRMMELIIKPLPENYTPTLDEACTWFPLQAVIECTVVDDEIGKPCAVVKFETAEEAVAAHACKPFIHIKQKVTKKDAEGNEKEETVTTNCNVFMRGVEAHFGSLLTYYDQKKKSQEQNRTNAKNRKTGGQQQPIKRPAGSTIRGPAQKRRAPSPSKPRGTGGKDTAPRGGGRGGVSRTPGRGGQAAIPRRNSPPRSSVRGGRANASGMTRSAPRTSYNRNDSFANQQRAPMRAEAFSGYSSYGQFDNRYQDRPQVDPFGRPMYGNSQAFGSSFHRDDAAARGYANFQDRRRY